MMAVFVVLAVIAWLLMFIGGIMLLVAAFREGLGWGFALLFLSPIAQFLFVIMHWEEAKNGFFTLLAGGVALGVALGAGMAAGLESSMDMNSIKEWSATEHVPSTPSAFIPSVSKGEDRPAPSVEDLRGTSGWPLNKIKDKFGAPLGTMRTGGKTVLCYPGVDIESTDGVTASAVVERVSR